VKFPPTREVQIRDYTTVAGQPVAKTVRRWDDTGVMMLQSLPREGWRRRRPAGDPASAFAQEVIELRSMDYWPQPKVRWTVTWNLGAIQRGCESSDY
jgi:hypothetical protein